MGYDSKTRYEALQAIRSGATLHEAEGLVGASRETVRRWCASEGISFLVGCRGGAVVPKRRRARTRPARLDLAQRLAIASGVAAGMTHAQIAQGIGFSRSTVSREISRHGGGGGAYDPYAAQMRAERAASRPKARKPGANARLRAYVIGKLALRWSPAQISARLELDFPDEEAMRATREAICRAPCVQGRGALRQELKPEKALRSGRRARLPRSRLAAKRGAGKSWAGGARSRGGPPRRTTARCRGTGRATSSSEGTSRAA